MHQLQKIVWSDSVSSLNFEVKIQHQSPTQTFVKSPSKPLKFTSCLQEVRKKPIRVFDAHILNNNQNRDLFKPY